MNFIFSHSDDYTTKLVLEWVDYLGKDFIRLNDERMDIRNIVINKYTYDYSFKIGNNEFQKNEINAKWFRGGKIRIANNVYDPSLFEKKLKTSSESAILFLSNYSHTKLEFLINEFSDSLGTNALGRYNKILALRNARQVGLDIPDTLITTSKESLFEFYKKHERVITKSLDLSFSSAAEINSEGNRVKYIQYTNELPADDLKKFPDIFALTLFQELVVKKLEIRTFYLMGNCYSIAIFSQQNKKTEIDYRRYDHKKMNRMIPIKLPATIESKIIDFMRLSKLNTGSIDIIYDTKGCFNFLEVNPIGQFGYVSEVCNYNLHKKIAECLVQPSKKTKKWIND
jgi:ATP-GRASP peptide maturase of grasp-with-spasm system